MLYKKAGIGSVGSTGISVVRICIMKLSKRRTCKSGRLYAESELMFFHRVVSFSGQPLLYAQYTCPGVHDYLSSDQSVADWIFICWFDYSRWQLNFADFCSIICQAVVFRKSLEKASAISGECKSLRIPFIFGHHPHTFHQQAWKCPKGIFPSTDGKCPNIACKIPDHSP